MKIGKNIKAIRVSQKIEQKELANRLHISNKTVSSWECDRTEPNIGMFEKIAEALNVTKMELLEGRKKAPDTIVIDAVGPRKKIKNAIFVEDTHPLSSDERELLQMYRTGQYKELINKVMEKMP
jgi:transcriptional regulator with XRE-family HTH domain